MVSHQTEGVNTDTVSPRANNVNRVEVVSPVESGIIGVDGSGHVGVSPIVNSGNRKDDLPRVSGKDDSPRTKVENDMDVSEHADTGNGFDDLSSVSDGDVTDDPQQLMKDVPHENGQKGVDVSPTKSGARGVVPPHVEHTNVGDVIPHGNVVNGADISQHVNSTSESEVSPQNGLQSVNKRSDVSQRPDREDANTKCRRNASPAVNGANRVDVSQHVKWSTNRIAAPHKTFAKGIDSSPPPRPRKPMPALLTSFEKEFIDESVKDNERKQREQERYLLTVSETRKELQQKGIDSLHRSLDMGKIKECLEWQRMMQDRLLYRNAEIRRSNSLKVNMIVAEKKPKFRFRPADSQSLCPRLLSMDYPAGVRIRLRKKLEIARVEMRRLHQGPVPERESQPGGKDKQSPNAKEVLGEQPQQKPVEKWNPRFGGFPPRSAVSAAINVGESNENRQHGSLSRHSKASKGNKTIGWSDLEPRSRKTSTNLKRSLVQSAKGPGRQRETQSPNRFPAPRRTMSAAEPVRPKKGVLEEILRLRPPARTQRNHPLGDLMLHDRARGDSGGGRKFVADLIREAKQEAKDSPNIRTKPLVIYLP